MKIKKLAGDEFMANCYIIWDESTARALVIDPGIEVEKIVGAIKKERLDLQGIIDTHAHIDHILANDFLREITGVSLFIHPAEVSSLSNPELNLSWMTGKKQTFRDPDCLIEDGEEMEVGRIRLKILHTPGHTPGSICLFADGCLLSGDTVFAGSVGRCDFPGGDFQKLEDSIKKILISIPDETQVFPGHGPETTLRAEKKFNPFFRRIVR